MGRFLAIIPPVVARGGQSLRSTFGLGARMGVLSLAGIELLTRVMSSHPLVEMVTNLRVQLLISALALSVGLIAVRSRLVSLALVLASISIVDLAGYALADGVDPAAGDGSAALTVMQYNVLATNLDYDAIAARVNDEDADIVVLSEVTSRHLIEVTQRLDGPYPHMLAEPWDDHTTHVGGGLVVLSRHPLTEVTVAQSATPAFRPMIAAMASIEGEEVLVVALHLPASRTDPVKVDLRERQLEMTRVLVESYAGPAVLIGDFNLAPTSPLYRDFLKDLNWQDPHRLVGWQPTWSFHNLPLGLPIDHVLTSPEFETRRYEVGDGAGSDHKTLTAALDVTG